MSKKKKEIKADENLLSIRSDTPEVHNAMIQFFNMYKDQLPLYVRDFLAKEKISVDPVIEVDNINNVIFVNSIDNNKGVVMVKEGDRLVSADYGTVAIDTRYVIFTEQAFIVCNKTAVDEVDPRLGSFGDIGTILEQMDDIGKPVTLPEAPVVIPNEGEAKMEVVND